METEAPTPIPVAEEHEPQADEEQLILPGWDVDRQRPPETPPPADEDRTWMFLPD